MPNQYFRRVFAVSPTMLGLLSLFACFAIGIASAFEPETHKNWALLPYNTCGQVSSSRIVGGKEAPMNAYPWIARIGYKVLDVKGYSFRCGGSLINSRTVLTAAHCVTKLPSAFKVGIVRLGEHDTNTDPDCQDNYCANPVVDIKPSEILIPKDYNVPIFKHDIALILLEKSVKYSASIKPICLPSGKLYTKLHTGDIAEVAGWGIEDIVKVRSSTRLQTVSLPILSNEECKPRIPRAIDLGPTQMCAGGVRGKDSCSGDSGGPLMKVDDGDDGPRYYLVGLVSFGPRKCGNTTIPGVYTRTSSYMKWVLDNLNGVPDDITVSVFKP